VLWKQSAPLWEGSDGGDYERAISSGGLPIHRQLGSAGESMTEVDIEDVLRRFAVGEPLLFGIGPQRNEGRAKARDVKKLGDVRPRVEISRGDLLGGQFREGRVECIARENARYKAAPPLPSTNLREGVHSDLGHDIRQDFAVYPQSNGKIEGRHKSLKGECMRLGTPLPLDDARRLVEGYVGHYTNVRLNSAAGYITPKDMLACVPHAGGATAGDPRRARPEAPDEVVY
jgi:hypothetical protein